MNERKLFDTFGRSYPAGHVLFREGDPGAEMFVVQSGEVEIAREIHGVQTVLAVLAAGEFFGEMAIVNRRPRSATALVRSAARLLVIDGNTFESMLRGRLEIGVRMIRTLAARLDRANQQIDLLLLEDANHRVVKCLRQLADAQGAVTPDGAPAVFIPVTVPALAARVALSDAAVAEVLDRLADAKLVIRGRDAGFEHEGFVVPEVGRLSEFLEFLDLRDRCRGGS